MENMMVTRLEDRSFIAIGGEDHLDFLNNILTQSVSPNMPEIVSAALLTPQGKLLDEFLLVKRPEDILLDCHASRRQAITDRLKLYKLRSRVTLEEHDGHPVIFWGDHQPSQGLQDPRHARLGYRSYDAKDISEITATAADWHHLRLTLGIAEGPAEMEPGTQFPLEMGLHLTHTIDFKKGCFIGQEVTSRSFRRGTLRKGVFPCRIAAEGAAPAPIMAGDRQVGDLLCQRGEHGLAHIRFDALELDLDVNGIKITPQAGLFTQ